MKKLYALIVAVALVGFCNAQITVTDASLAQWLQQNFPACMNGNQLNATCYDVLNATELDNVAVDQDITALSYFPRVKFLSIAMVGDNGLYGTFPDSLTYLELHSASPGRALPLWNPAFPSTLTHLTLWGFQVTTPPAFPPFPNGLTYLDFEINGYGSFPAGVPASVDTLMVDFTNLSGTIPGLPPNLTFLQINTTYGFTITSIPASLKYLEVSYASSPITLPVLTGTNITTFYCVGSDFLTVPALPLNLQTLNCYGNNLASLPTLPASLQYLNCSYNNILALPALPASITYLDISKNKLTSLSAWPASDSVIICDYNKFTSLPAFPAGLKQLSCFNDSLANLPAFRAGLLSLTSGGIKLKTLPAIPSSLTSLWLEKSAVTTVPMLPQGCRSVQCFDNPKLSVVTNLPDSLWSAGFNGDSSLSCLPPYKYVGNLQITGTHISCLPSYRVDYCDTTISSYPLCMVSDPNGCPLYWNISGATYSDQNNNCTHQNGEPFLYPVKINLLQGGSVLQQAYFQGVYSFKTDYNTYTVQVDTTDLPFQFTCTGGNSASVTVSAIDSLHSGINFEGSCKTGFDIGVNSIVNNSGFFPGDSANVIINAGDVIRGRYGISCSTGGLSGQVQVTLNGPVSYAGTYGGTPAPDNITGSVLTWNVADFSQLNPAFKITLVTATTATLGQPVCITVNVTPVVGDNNTANNNATQCLGVVNSHDPNSKEVSPPGALSYPYNDWLTYTIHFQNTGTAAARNIHIMDTLDANVDPSTFQLLAASVDPTVQITGRYVTFSFPQINLPDSTDNPTGSIGYVQYRVKPMNNLMPGVSVHNTAYIYFDFNAPVATNDAANDIEVATGVKQVMQSIISIYPNPTNSSWQLAVGKELIGAKLEVYDAIGRVAFHSEINNQQSEIPATTLPVGVYFIRISNGAEVQTVKVVKE